MLSSNRKNLNANYVEIITTETEKMQETTTGIQVSYILFFAVIGYPSSFLFINTVSTTAF